MSDFKLEIMDDPSPEDLKVLCDGLDASLPDGLELRNFRKRAIFLKDSDEKVVANHLLLPRWVTHFGQNNKWQLFTRR